MAQVLQWKVCWTCSKFGTREGRSLISLQPGLDSKQAGHWQCHLLKCAPLFVSSLLGASDLASTNHTPTPRGANGPQLLAFDAIRPICPRSSWTSSVSVRNTNLTNFMYSCSKMSIVTFNLFRWSTFADVWG